VDASVFSTKDSGCGRLSARLRLRSERYEFRPETHADPASSTAGEQVSRQLREAAWDLKEN
jgi:hypothetical protein